MALAAHISSALIAVFGGDLTKCARSTYLIRQVRLDSRLGVLVEKKAKAKVKEGLIDR